MNDESSESQCSQEALQHYNVNKNRYNGNEGKMPSKHIYHAVYSVCTVRTVCTDANSMVYLKPTGGLGSDFINASFVNVSVIGLINISVWYVHVQL